MGNSYIHMARYWSSFDDKTDAFTAQGLELNPLLGGRKQCIGHVRG
jgi:hypothetical protein